MFTWIFTKVAEAGRSGEATLYLLSALSNESDEGSATVYFQNREAAVAVAQQIGGGGNFRAARLLSVDCDESPEGWYVFASVPAGGFVPEEIAVSLDGG